MKKFFTKLALLAGAGLLTMCNNTEPDALTLNVSPGADTIGSLYAGEKALYEVKISTSHSDCTLKITTFEQTNGLQVQLDTAFNSAEAKYDYEFTAPELGREKSEVKLTFTATDSEGNEATAVRKINVHNRNLATDDKTDEQTDEA